MPRRPCYFCGWRGPDQRPARALKLRTSTQVLPTHSGRVHGAHVGNRQLAGLGDLVNVVLADPAPSTSTERSAR